MTHIDYPSTSLKAYLILDEQSKGALVRRELLNFFDIHSPRKEYTLSSSWGKFLISGRRANGFAIYSLKRKSEIHLLEVIECQDIPNNRNEIPTSDFVKHHPRLGRIMTELSPHNCEAKKRLLVGRDFIDAHYFLEQVIGPPNSPFFQKTDMSMGDHLVHWKESLSR